MWYAPHALLFLPYALLTIPFLPRFVVYIMRHVYLRAMFFIVCLSSEMFSMRHVVLSAICLRALHVFVPHVFFCTLYDSVSHVLCAC